MDELRPAIKRVRKQLQACVRGKPQVIERCLVATLSAGHILLEDQPGVGKTTLARALATSLGVSFSRLSFTADMLPSDILGMSVWSPKSESFRFHPGPVFSQILLADEINRAPARTQSALLQAMAEKTVSVDGQERGLFAGFCVIATQNPSDHSGTYPLPQSQRDRFSVRVSMGYPDPRSEQEIYAGERQEPQELSPALDADALCAIQEKVHSLAIHPKLASYVQALAQASRSCDRVEIGLSVRAGLSWLCCAKAKAWLDDRDTVLPDDLQELALVCLPHRMWVRDCPVFSQQQHAQELVQEFLAKVPLP